MLKLQSDSKQSKFYLRKTEYLVNYQSQQTANEEKIQKAMITRCMRGLLVHGSQLKCFKPEAQFDWKTSPNDRSYISKRLRRIQYKRT